jgi:hypothetical protein
MVLALLDGRKTQTRRVVDPLLYVETTNPDRVINQSAPDFGDALLEWGRCPFGQPGDRLWVRETFRLPAMFDAISPSAVGQKVLDAGYRRPWAPIQYEADGATANWAPSFGAPGKARPATHMPRWASRLTLEVVSVRVERVQTISEEDARAEGIERISHVGALRAFGWRDYSGGPGFFAPISSFKSLWESIYGPDDLGAWDTNPWVWVVTFKTVEVAHVR